MKQKRSIAAVPIKVENENDKATETKILDAAEKLFSEYGYDATAIRMINLIANVNSGAIHYYFRTKEDLFRRVVLRRSRIFAEDRLARLAACREDADRQPLLDQIIEAYVMPYTNPALGSPEERLRFARLRARLMLEQRNENDSPLREPHEAAGQRFVDALADSLPHLSHSEVQFRYLIMWSALNTLSAGLGRAAFGGQIIGEGDHPMVELQKMIPQLVQLFTAFFRAPSTEPASK
jgi:AcrR family transcriptional regulator